MSAISLKQRVVNAAINGFLVSAVFLGTSALVTVIQGAPSSVTFSDKQESTTIMPPTDIGEAKCEVRDPKMISDLCTLATPEIGEATARPINWRELREFSKE